MLSETRLNLLSDLRAFRYHHKHLPRPEVIEMIIKLKEQHEQMSRLNPHVYTLKIIITSTW